MKKLVGMKAIGAFDARVARQMKLKLATLDGNLIAAAKREKVTLFQ